ncbi:MAG: hypothetical protein M3290_13280, partial [Actinomycetota bacterium]|nr:hypothetical protein [Actinomycetota bacterium]
VTDGNGVYACTPDQVLDLLRRGQGVLGAVVAVSQIRDQLQGTLRELRPTAVPVGYVAHNEDGVEAKEG